MLLFPAEVLTTGVSHSGAYGDGSAPYLSVLLLVTGHVARAGHKQDHHRVIAASLRPPIEEDLVDALVLPG